MVSIHKNDQDGQSAGGDFENTTYSNKGGKKREENGEFF